MYDLSWLNPTPHAIAVYASRPLSPVATQHSLPSGRCPLLGPDFHRLDRTSLPGARNVRTRFSYTKPVLNRTCGFPAYAPTRVRTAPVVVYAPAPVSREPGSEPSTCIAGAHSPWSPPLAPPTPLRPPPQMPPQWASFALFAGFTATMARSDFSRPCIIGFGSSPSRNGSSLSRNACRSDTRPPMARCDPFAPDVALDPGRASAPP